MAHPEVAVAARPAVLDHLDTVCTTQGLDVLSERLRRLQLWMESDVATIETLMVQAMAELGRPGVSAAGARAVTEAGVVTGARGAVTEVGAVTGQSVARPSSVSPASHDDKLSIVHRAALGLLERGGKRLRPLCVALASRVGTGFDLGAQQLAVAVELVHTATLLHDDVIDTGEMRRGAVAPRILYGNAASIYAGDWMLIEAIRRVRSSRVEQVLDRLLAIIEEMIFAEAIQLERRGRIEPDRTSYFQVVEGKTAALFRWAMYAGAQAGQLDGAVADALEQYGLHLGVAFQAMDDLLDLSGEASTLGKSLFADLREGKMTYPLIIALEREPELAAQLEAIIAPDTGALADAQLARMASTGKADDGQAFAGVREALLRTDAFEETRKLARSRIAAANASLAVIPSLLGTATAKEALSALEVVAEATLLRSH